MARVLPFPLRSQTPENRFMTMRAEKLLGRWFRTVDSDVRFQVVGWEPDAHEVRLYHPANRSSQRVPYTLFFQALASGAIEDSE